MNAALADKVLTAVIAGAFGGFLGAGIRWIEQRAERRRRRRAVATALLDELRVIELNARQLVQEDFAAKIASLPVTRPGQLFRQISASDDLFLLRPETVSRLLFLESLNREIDEDGVLYRSLGDYDRAYLNHRVRSKAWFLATHIRAMRDALVGEGGTRPPKEAIPILQNWQLPELGPAVFEEWTVPPSSQSDGVWVNAAGRPAPDQ
jgi:hypothetical protein